MVDRQQGLVGGHGQRLARHQPNHHPADQPRPGGGGNRVDLIQPQPGVGQRRFDKWGQPLGVGARGNLGHHPAIGAMFGILAGDPLGEHGAVFTHQRGGGFIARAFYSQHYPHRRFP